MKVKEALKAQRNRSAKPSRPPKTNPNSNTHMDSGVTLDASKELATTGFYNTNESSGDVSGRQTGRFKQRSRSRTPLTSN